MKITMYPCQYNQKLHCIDVDPNMVIPPNCKECIHNTEIHSNVKETGGMPGLAWLWSIVKRIIK